MIDIAARIKNILSKEGKNITWLAEQLGYSRQGLINGLRNKTIKFETLEKISDILGVPLKLLFSPRSTEVDSPHDFIESYYSKMLVNRYDKISDKIAILKDLYVSEVFYLTSKRIDLVYPVRYPGSPKYIFDKSNPDELNFYTALSENKIDRFIYEPFSQASDTDNFLYKSFNYFFEAFYFILFLTNTLNIKDFLNEGIALDDDELMKYWKKYKPLDEKYHFK